MTTDVTEKDGVTYVNFAEWKREKLDPEPMSKDAIIAMMDELSHLTIIGHTPDGKVNLFTQCDGDHNLMMQLLNAQAMTLDDMIEDVYDVET